MDRAGLRVTDSGSVGAIPGEQDETSQVVTERDAVVVVVVVVIAGVNKQLYGRLPSYVRRTDGRTDGRKSGEKPALDRNEGRRYRTRQW